MFDGMFVTPDPISTLVRLEHPENAQLLEYVLLPKRVQLIALKRTAGRLLQPEKILLAAEVTNDGISSVSDNPLQP